MKGIIKSFSRTRGYGFITAENEDYFFHISKINFNPVVNDPVEFKPKVTKKGKAAILISKGKE